MRRFWLTPSSPEPFCAVVQLHAVARMQHRTGFSDLSSTLSRRREAILKGRTRDGDSRSGKSCCYVGRAAIHRCYETLEHVPILMQMRRARV